MPKVQDLLVAGLLLGGSWTTGAAAVETPYFRWAPSQGADAAPAPDAQDNTVGDLTVQPLPPQGTRSGGAYASPAPAFSGASGPVLWSWAPGVSPPSWATVDPATGIVHGQAGNYGSFPNLAIRATDGSGAVRTIPFSLVVLGPPAASLPQASLDVALRVGSFLSLAPQATNIVGAPTWGIPWVSGDIPGGVSLDSSTGVLSGTVTTPGSARFPFQVTDGYDRSEATTQAARVTAYPPLAFSSAPTDVLARPGDALAASPPALLNRIGAVSYGLRGTASLPDACPGLRFDPSTGVIAGSTSSNCTLTGLSYGATDDGGGVAPLRSSAASQPFSLTVGTDLVALTQPSYLLARRGSTPSTTARVGNAPVGSLTWTVAAQDGSAMPAWLTQAPGTCAGGSTTCTLVAAPGDGIASGTYPATGGYLLTATDGDGSSLAFAPFRVTVAEPAVTAATATTSYVTRVNAPLTTSPVTATGGTGSYTFALETLSGTAPQSYTVSPTNGAVTFTPVQVSTWTYRIRVTSKTDAQNVALAPQVSVTTNEAFTVTVADITIHATTNYWHYTAVNNTATPTVTGAKGKVTWGKPNITVVTVDPDTGTVTAGNSPQYTGDARYQVTATDTSDGSKATLNGFVRRLGQPSVRNPTTGVFVRRGVPYKSPWLGINPTIGTTGYPVYSLAYNTNDGSNSYQSCGNATLLDGIQLTQDGYLTGTYTGPVQAQGGFVKSACYRATDSDGAYAGTALNFYVADPMTLTGFDDTEQLTKGIDYSKTMTLANALGKVTWSVDVALPAGMSWATTASSARVYGRPTGTDSATVTFTATDAWDKSTVSRTVTFAGNQPLAVTAPPGLTARYSALYAFDAPQVTGGTAPYTWSFSPYSTQLTGKAATSSTFSTATGALSGRNYFPLGTTGIVLRVTDATGVVGDSAPFTMKTTANTIAATSPGLSTALRFHVGATRSVQATSTGAARPRYLALFDDGYGSVGKALPDWLALTDSGTFTGTPPATSNGTMPLTVIDDTDGAYTTTNIPLQALAPLSFTTQPSDVKGAPNVAIPAMQAAVGTLINSASYTLSSGGSDISTTLGTLCPGLSFSGGVVYGTPRSTCSLTGLTMTGTDPADGQSATSAPFSITVANGTAASISGYSQVFVQNLTQAGFVSASQNAAYFSNLNDNSAATGYTMNSSGASSQRPPTLNAYFDTTYQTSAVGLDMSCAAGTFWLIVNDDYRDTGLGSFTGTYDLGGTKAVGNIGVQCKQNTSMAVRTLKALP